VRGAVFAGLRRVEVRDLPDPRLEDARDAIVEVRLAGVCGSDLHPYHEREPGLEHGTVMGHEAVGVVVEVGRAVTRLAKGDVVCGPFTTSCGACFFCTSGLTCRCTKGQLFGWRQGGAGLHGLQASHARVPLGETTLVKVPEGIGLEEALLLGDVLATGWFSAELAGVAPGGTYAVVGAGPVGLMAALAATEKKARIFAVDTVPERLALAAKIGAEPIDARTATPRDVLLAATDGRGADGVLEAVGSPSAQRVAYELVRAGGTIATVGVHTAPHFAFSPAEAYDKNLTYRVGRCPARRLIPELLEVARRRAADLRSIISHRMPLGEAARAYTIFDQKLEGCTKVVLTP
jgi:threonine dehydrogenase-like Zn-dependent dehydrogenase